MILKDIKLRNKLKKIIKSNHVVADIVLFGSVVRGKENPNDLDILVIFNQMVDKNVEFEIRKTLEAKYANISIISKTKKGVVDPSFDARESILFEAISLINGENLAEKYGFGSWGMFKYNFFGWDKLQKTKFYHALNGRSGKEGIFQKLGCIKLSDQVVLVSLRNIEDFREFLESWKLDYKYFPLLIPSRLGKKKILER